MSWKDILKVELEIPDVVQFDTSALSDKCCSDARTALMRLSEEDVSEEDIFDAHDAVEEQSCEELKEAVKIDIKNRESINWESYENSFLDKDKELMILNTLREILKDWEECERRD
tara:strand:- start:171 stop:515 length:345 start_codon:yes stop_codon:yes gene_type:complete